ncbi:AraC family transcriptional regulator [Larkinella soli]|uniref:AraC family transcriptional regulator n=1 Tax=Larkinella soli TaxID=1770527 RepID=UPI000FFC99CE|nr:AraC family transcriptional regulator [Larkinella soli]
MYTTVYIIRNIIYNAAARGADLQRLCDGVGLRPEDLSDTERRIPGVEPITRLWEEILRTTGDEVAGLHLGEQNTPGVLGMVGHLIQSCPTMKEAVLAMREHQRMLSGWVSYDLERVGDGYAYSYGVDPLWQNVSPVTARHAVEMAMSSSVSIARLLTGRKLVPLRAEFSYPENGSPDEYRRIFKCPLHFNCPTDRLLFRREDFEAPLLNYDRSVYALLNHLLAEKKKEVLRSMRFSDQVQSVLMQDFKGQVPPVEVIALHMNLSLRSFQRRLAGEGSSYRAVCSQLKKELAVRMIRNTDAKVQAIADVLGYTESSSFRKALKTWTNATPTQIKKEMSRF